MHPLDGATVVIHDPAGTTVAKTVTGKDGKFTFPGVPFGDYTVEASRPGFVWRLPAPAAEFSRRRERSSSSSSTARRSSLLTRTGRCRRRHRSTGSLTTVDAPGTRRAARRRGPPDHRRRRDAARLRPGRARQHLRARQPRRRPVPGRRHPGAGLGRQPVRGVDPRAAVQTSRCRPAVCGRVWLSTGRGRRTVTRQPGDHPEGNAQTCATAPYNTVEPGAAYSTKLADRSGVFIGGSFNYSERALEAPSIIRSSTTTGATAHACSVATTTSSARCNRYELFAMYAHNRYQVPIDPSVDPLDPSRPELRARRTRSATSRRRSSRMTRTRPEPARSVRGDVVDHKLEHGQVMLAPIYKLSRGTLLGDPEHALGMLADPGATASDVTQIAASRRRRRAVPWQTGSHLFKTGAQTDFLHGLTRFTSYTRDDAAGGGIASEAGGSDQTNALLSGVYVQASHLGRRADARCRHPVRRDARDARGQQDERHVRCEPSLRRVVRVLEECGRPRVHGREVDAALPARCLECRARARRGAARRANHV